MEFLCWQLKWWLNKQNLIVMDNPVFEEGLNAYAQQQATLKVDLEKHFIHVWRNMQRYVDIANGDTDCITLG